MLLDLPQPEKQNFFPGRLDVPSRVQIHRLISHSSRMSGELTDQNKQKQNVFPPLFR